MTRSQNLVISGSKRKVLCVFKSICFFFAFKMFNQLTVISAVTFILFSLTSIGFVLEDRRIGGMMEILRSGAVILYVFLTPGIGPVLRQVMHGVYGLSIGLWSMQLAVNKPSFHTKDYHSHKNGVQNGASNKKSN